MKLERTSPCFDCAFRVNAKPGWLGPYTAIEFATRIEMTDGEEPCHTNTDYSNLDDAPFCAGALAFLANMYKDPRDPERSACVSAVGRTKKVF